MPSVVTPPFTGITIVSKADSITPSPNIDILTNANLYNFVEIDAFIKGNGAADVYRAINLTDPQFASVNFDYSGFRNNGAALSVVAPTTLMGAMQITVNPGNLNTNSLCHLNIKIRNNDLASKPFLEVVGSTYINATTILQFMYTGKADVIGTIDTLRITDVGGLNFHADSSYICRGYKQ